MPALDRIAGKVPDPELRSGKFKLALVSLAAGSLRQATTIPVVTPSGLIGNETPVASIRIARARVTIDDGPADTPAIGEDPGILDHESVAHENQRLGVRPLELFRRELGDHFPLHLPDLRPLSDPVDVGRAKKHHP